MYVKSIDTADMERFNAYYGVIVSEQGEDAVFYASEPLYNVTVNEMDYDYDKNEFVLKEQVYQIDELKKDDAIVITFDTKKDIPYVMISATDKKGEQLERFLYKSQNTHRMVLLERE